MVVAKSAVATLLALPAVLAHIGDSPAAVARERALIAEHHRLASRGIAQCQNAPSMIALKERAVARRDAKAKELRAARGLESKPMMYKKRDLESLSEYVDVSRNMTDVYDYNLSTPDTTIFDGKNTCALVPETTIGPYWVTGEFITSDITFGEPGTPLHFEVQFVDYSTCEAIPDLVADVWHANTTGFYSGLGNGEGSLNSTFLRGVQISDSDGVAEFDTVFPGHYSQRVTHIHVLTQTNYTILDNNTYTGGTALHIGQLYFNDDLIQAVEAFEPYNQSTVEFTSWEDDGWELDEATSDYNPLMEYVYLSNDVNDGLLAWITIGIDLSANHNANVSAAANYYAGGGVSSNNGGGFPGGGGGGFPPNGTTPPFLEDE